MLERTVPRDVQRQAFHTDVIEGLSKPRKSLPSRWLYDDRGSELFEDITQLEEYYPSRTETAILHARAVEIARFCGPQTVVVEYGAGAGVKTEILLGALEDPVLYVPIDIAGDFLEASARRIESRFPQLKVRPVVADFTQEFALPQDLPADGRRTGFFPGSTIGNLDRPATEAFLRRMREHVGTGGTGVVGVDLRKDLDTMLRAYDDSSGVTAAFNRNVLRRINRELQGDFRLEAFVHEARWNEAESAVEMHLRSLEHQRATVDGAQFTFAPGETIHTESSRKYSIDGFAEVALSCGWTIGQVWTDPAGLLAVIGLRTA